VRGGRVGDVLAFLLSAKGGSGRRNSAVDGWFAPIPVIPLRLAHPESGQSRGRRGPVTN
jgi:hypothetical protein